MENVQKISKLQVILILIVFRLTVAFTFIPAINTPPANQDAWIVELLSIPYTMIFCLPLLYLGSKFKNMSLIEYSQRILGKLIGKLVGLLYIVFMIFEGIMLVSMVIGVMGSAIMPETPSSAIAFLLLLSSSYIAYKGIVSIAIGGEIFAPFILIIAVAFNLLGLNNVDFKVFLPILADSSFLDLNFGAISIAFRFVEIILLSMIVPYIKEGDKLYRIIYFIILISMLVVVSITISTLGTLGVEQAKHSRFPFFVYSRFINLFDFIQRIESINFIAWLVLYIGKLSMYLCLSSVGMTQIFGGKSNKKYLIFITLIVYVLSMTLKTSKTVIADKILSYQVFPYINMVFILIIPFILLLVYFMRRETINKSLGM